MAFPAGRPGAGGEGHLGITQTRFTQGEDEITATVHRSGRGWRRLVSRGGPWVATLGVAGAPQMATEASTKLTSKAL